MFTGHFLNSLNVSGPETENNSRPWGLSKFDKLRNKSWYIAPLTSSIIGSIIDTFLFFSIAFYGTDVPWFTLALGDLAVKLTVALIMLIPFRLLIYRINDLNNFKIKNLNY